MQKQMKSASRSKNSDFQQIVPLPFRLPFNLQKQLHFPSDEDTRFAQSQMIAQCVRLAERLLPDKIDDPQFRGDLGLVPLMRPTTKGAEGGQKYCGRNVEARTYRIPREFDPPRDEDGEEKSEKRIRKLPHRPQYESFSTRMKGLVAGMLRDMGIKPSLLSRWCNLFRVSHFGALGSDKFSLCGLYIGPIATVLEASSSTTRGVECAERLRHPGFPRPSSVCF